MNDLEYTGFQKFESGLMSALYYYLHNPELVEEKLNNGIVYFHTDFLPAQKIMNSDAFIAALDMLKLYKSVEGEKSVGRRSRAIYTLHQELGISLRGLEILFNECDFFKTYLPAQKILEYSMIHLEKKGMPQWMKNVLNE